MYCLMSALVSKFHNKNRQLLSTTLSKTGQNTNITNTTFMDFLSIIH